MIDLAEIIKALLRPLEGGIIFAAIFAGLIFGYGYNRRLRLPARLIFHKWVAAAVFLIFVAAVRWVITGTVQPAGYVGVAILWGIYCIFIYLGTIFSLKGIKWRFFGRGKRSTKTSKTT